MWVNIHTKSPSCDYYDEIEEEFREFLREPRTKKEIKDKFNMGEQKFRVFISWASVNWPIWEDFEDSRKYGWLERESDE